MMRNAIFAIVVMSSMLPLARSEQPAVYRTDSAPCNRTASDLDAFVSRAFSNGVPFDEARAFAKCPWATSVLLDLLKRRDHEADADNIVLTLGISGRVDAIQGLKDFLEGRGVAGKVNATAYRAKSDVPVALGCILNEVYLERTGRSLEPVNSASVELLDAYHRELLSYLSEGMSEGWNSKLAWSSQVHATNADRQVDLAQQTMLGFGLSGDPDARCVLEWATQHIHNPKVAGSLAKHCGVEAEGPHNWVGNVLEPNDQAQLLQALARSIPLNLKIAESSGGLAGYYRQAR